MKNDDGISGWWWFTQIADIVLMSVGVWWMDARAPWWKFLAGLLLVRMGARLDAQRNGRSWWRDHNV